MLLKAASNFEIIRFPEDSPSDPRHEKALACSLFVVREYSLKLAAGLFVTCVSISLINDKSDSFIRNVWSSTPSGPALVIVDLTWLYFVWTLNAHQLWYWWALVRVSADMLVSMVRRLRLSYRSGCVSLTDFRAQFAETKREIAIMTSFLAIWLTLSCMLFIGCVMLFVAEVVQSGFSATQFLRLGYLFISYFPFAWSLWDLSGVQAEFCLLEQDIPGFSDSVGALHQALSVRSQLYYNQLGVRINGIVVKRWYLWQVPKLLQTHYLPAQ
jgi:hypothetical protein